MITAAARAKWVYLQMAKKQKLVSPELEEFEEKRRYKRKRAKLRETAAKTAADIQQKAARYSDAVIEEMAEIVFSPKAVESAKIQAGNVILDRALGKAVQPNINSNVNTDGKPSEVTGSALAKRIEATLRRIEELTGGRSEKAAGPERPSDLRECDSDSGSSTKH